MIGIRLDTNSHRAIVVIGPDGVSILENRDSSSATTLTTTSVTLPTGTEIPVIITVNGTSISATVNGTTYTGVLTTALTSTKASLGNGTTGGITILYDYFESDSL